MSTRRANALLPPKLILSPIDFSNPSTEAMDTAAALADQFKAELCLVYVVPALPKLPADVSIFEEGEYKQKLHADAVRRLESLVEKYQNQGIQARFMAGTANDVGMGLVRIAEQEKADLIVIATHGMTGWRRLAFGSVTVKVVRTTECPVLMLRARAESMGATPRSPFEKSSLAQRETPAHSCPIVTTAIGPAWSRSLLCEDR
jgi:nucleotide-binding universal stress UspA family protein